MTMAKEQVAARKCALTDRAWKWFLLGVRALVALQVLETSKGAGAGDADMRAGLVGFDDKGFRWDLLGRLDLLGGGGRVGRGGRSRGDDGRGFKLNGVMIHSHSIDHQKQTCVGGGGGSCRGGCRGERLGGSKGVGTAREESSGYDGTGDEKQGTRDLFI